MSRWSPDLVPAGTLRGEWRLDFPMREIASWRAGGALTYAYAPKDTLDVSRLLSVLPEEMPVVFIGNATNMLVVDSGFDGVGILLPEVVKNANRGLNDERMIYMEAGCLSVFAGVSCARAAYAALENGLAGLEFLSGIPGTIGGALTMNAGCHGSAIWQFVDRVETVDRAGRRRLRTASEFTAGYREVLPNHAGVEWFLRAFFRLCPETKTVIQERMQMLSAWRKAHQPLQWPSAGSVFRNPAGDAAGRLIEECGFKGLRIGDAEVSLQHGNFILNKGQATAEDILTLIDRVQSGVREKTGITLKLEVHVLR